MKRHDRANRKNSVFIHIFQLFLLNLEPEWLALFSEVPESSHGLTYASTVDGCTNIHLPIPESKQVLKVISFISTIFFVFSISLFLWTIHMK